MPAQRAQRADGHRVVGGDECGGRIGQGEQVGRGPLGPGGLRVAVHEETLVVCQTGRGETLLVAGDALTGGTEPGQARDKGDPAVPQPGEVGHEQGRRRGTLGTDLVETRGARRRGGTVRTVARHDVLRRAGVDQPVQEHRRYGVAAQVTDEVTRVRGRGDDHAVHPAFMEELHDLALVPGVVVRIRDEQAVARLQGSGLDALEDLREVRVADGRHREADGAGARGHQGAGQGVRGVAEGVDGVEHGLAGMGEHRTRAVEHVGDGRHGDPGTTGDIRHGGHRAPFPEPAVGSAPAPVISASGRTLSHGPAPRKRLRKRLRPASVLTPPPRPASMAAWPGTGPPASSAGRAPRAPARPPLGDRPLCPGIVTLHTP